MKSIATNWEESLKFYENLLKIESEIEEETGDEGDKMEEEFNRTLDGPF